MNGNYKSLVQIQDKTAGQLTALVYNGAQIRKQTENVFELPSEIQKRSNHKAPLTLPKEICELPCNCNLSHWVSFASGLLYRKKLLKDTERKWRRVLPQGSQRMHSPERLRGRRTHNRRLLRQNCLLQPTLLCKLGGLRALAVLQDERFSPRYLHASTAENQKTREILAAVNI